MSDYNTLLETIDVPVLLMQGNPRQVVTANQKALALFEKKPKDVEGHRGCQVFDCIHSFTEAGCGKDANCEDCNIKKLQGSLYSRDTWPYRTIFPFCELAPLTAKHAFKVVEYRNNLVSEVIHCKKTIRSAQQNA